MKLRSPTTGQSLAQDTEHSLSAEGERWPVIDGIPYLRVGRDDLRRRTLEHLDGGRTDEALVLLLADQDDWWTGPEADAKDLRRLVHERDTLNLREAMALLGWGPVADYFTYRWSDPTFIAGLALLEAHWVAPGTVFELACGIGHYCRELSRCGVRCTGGDVVFAKCWIARHWFAPECEFVVFDAAATWPVFDKRFDLVHCQDAFYFLDQKQYVAKHLREIVEHDGVLAVGHLHNVAYAGGAKGPALAFDEWQALFPAAHIYDENELLRAMLDRKAPEQSAWRADAAVEAWSLVEGAGPPRPIDTGIAVPPPSATLRPNPLITENGIAWPSERYREEYGSKAPWADAAITNRVAPERTRVLVDLPERW